MGCGPQNGQVSGDKARDIFVKSQLDYEKLGLIWNLADTQKRGSLDLPDFIIGMYFIQSAMANSSLQLPTTLPPGLYEQASGGRPAPISPLAQQHSGPTSSPVRAQYTGGVMQPQLTGQSASGTPPRAPPSRQFSAQPAFVPRSAFGAAAAPWDVTAQAKATSDGFFAQLDPQNRGFVEGDVAVPFMVQSQLDEGTLASIWDLADIRQQGQLDRDEFAVAMHLINAKLAGQDVPQVLPQSLIPPSLRGQQPAQVSAPGQSSTAKDLFDLNFDDEPPKSNVAPPANFPPPAQPARAASAATPFAPSAFMPQPPSRQGTAEPTSRTISPVPQQPQTSVFGVSPFQRGLQRQTSDLLGDDAAEPTPEVPDRSADLGNAQNQLDNTTRSLESVSKDKEGLETKAKSTAAQLEELEQRLTEVRVRHETETKAVADLRLRVGEQETKLHQLQAEVIGAESDLSAMKSEKDELGQALLRDKEEVRGLQKRMKEVDDEKSTLKGLLEKMKKEARQQKGLVSIAKKQLSTAEGSRDGAQKELDEFSANRGQEEEEETGGIGLVGAAAAGAGLAGAAGLAAHELDKGKGKELERTDSVTSATASPAFGGPTSAASIPLPDTPRAMSPNPTGASNRSNNPFDRLGKPAVRSPPPPPPGATSPPATSASTAGTADGQSTPQEEGFGTKALLGAGAAMGVVAGVAVAGAETLYHAAKDVVSPDTHEEASKEVGSEAPAAQEEKDPFGLPNTGDQERTPTAAQQSQLDTDPFGAPSAPASAAPHQDSFDNAFDSTFDDSFGNTEPATSAAAPSTLTKSAPTDFDSAFADFDDEVAPPAPVSVPTIDEPAAGDSITALQDGLPSGIPASAIPDSLRPQNERTLSTQALAPESVPDSPVTEAAEATYQSKEVSPAPISRGAAPISQTITATRSNDGGSSDEEEEPEDLEAPRKVYSPRPDETREELEDNAPLGTSNAAPVAPASTYPLAPPVLSSPVDDSAPARSPAAEDPVPKTRRSAPPPPARVAAPAIDDFDPFAGSATTTAFHSEPVSASPEVAPAPQTATSGPKAAGFEDDDDFDFSDLPPAQVEQSGPAAVSHSAPTRGSAFDDEFANFDDDFAETGPSSQINSGSSGSMSKSYEIVSPTQAGGASAPQNQGPAAHYDEWGFGDSSSAPQARAATATAAPVSFDDAFGEEFEPA